MRTAVVYTGNVFMPAERVSLSGWSAWIDEFDLFLKEADLMLYQRVHTQDWGDIEADALFFLIMNMPDFSTEECRAVADALSELYQAARARPNSTEAPSAWLETYDTVLRLFRNAAAVRGKIHFSDRAK